MKQIIIAISGASGIYWGVRKLDVLLKLRVETHPVMTSWGLHSLAIENAYERSQPGSPVSHVREYENIGASIASFSFFIDGTIVTPVRLRSSRGSRIPITAILAVGAEGSALKERRTLWGLFEKPLHEGLGIRARSDKNGRCHHASHACSLQPPKAINDVIDRLGGQSPRPFSIEAQRFKRPRTKDEKEMKIVGPNA